MPFERELRRWTRLRPEILTRCAVKILDRKRSIPCELIDLSPGGVGLFVPSQTRFRHGRVVHVKIRFKGQPLVIRTAEVRRTLENDDGFTLGLSWRMTPEPWSETERRNQTRVALPPDTLFARTPLRHAHNVWTRLSVVDVNSDYGFQVETRGGPAYLLPGHRTELRLDIPHLHQQGWDCQVLWIRPSQGQCMRFGLRVLDPDPTLDEILSEWLQIRREWSPMELKRLGFGKDSLPGQYRFRKVEEISEGVSVANFLEEMSKRSTKTGMEPLHALEHVSDHDTVHLGCWDGRRLVAATTLDAHADELIAEHPQSKITNFAIEPNWIVPEVFLGLWEQIVRVFLASGNPSLWVWCPAGREHLFRLLGLDESIGLALPSGIGTWMCIHRERLISGIGMNAIRWVFLYSTVSGFVLEHQDRKLSLRLKMARWRRLGVYLILRDWREPKEQFKLREAIRQWALEVQENAMDS